MTPTKLRVTNEQLRGLAKDLVDKRELPFDMSLRDVNRNRSMAQNALYWVWVTYLSDQTGYTKDELHQIIKKRFLADIMLQHREAYPDLAETLGAIREVLDAGERDIAKRLWSSVVRLLTTTALEVPHFTELLHTIEHWARHELRHTLPQPLDSYADAMRIQE